MGSRDLASHLPSSGHKCQPKPNHNTPDTFARLALYDYTRNRGERQTVGEEGQERTFGNATQHLMTMGAELLFARRATANRSRSTGMVGTLAD